LVVDAKMSLLSWSDAQGTDPEQRQEALLKFRQSCRRHVLDLASKDYVGAVRERGLESLDFRFLFVPIEAAFQTVLQEDRDLYSFAFANKVILTSPTTLLAMLTTVQHTWKQYDIGKNAQAISERAGRMLDKLSDMVQAMDEMGRCLEKAQKQYHTTRGRLSDGAGNLLGQARKLQSLGVRGQKGLPSGGEDSVLDALD
jgi:DNA recombination protein RmuC